MVTMYVYRGYPGSGKSTIAQRNARIHGGVVIERDQIRFMLFNKYWGLKRTQEDTVTTTQHAIIQGAVKHGSNVHISDTNLNPKTIKGLIDLASDLMLRVVVIDVTTETSVCIERDRKRAAEGGRGVGDKAIRDMAGRYPMPWPNYVALGYSSEHDDIIRVEV